MPPVAPAAHLRTLCAESMPAAWPTVFGSVQVRFCILAFLLATTQDANHSPFPSGNDYRKDGVPVPRLRHSAAPPQSGPAGSILQQHKLPEQGGI